MPGARIVKIVVTKFTPPKMVPSPLTANPIIQRSAPIPGEYMWFESGAYAVQPKDAAPPGVKNQAVATVAPNR